MTFAAAALLITLLAGGAQEELERRARDIVRRSQANEITTVDARREVQQLLKDLRRWSEAENTELESRTRVYSSPAVGPGEALTVDRCAIFYEENLERLCPLDISRSEVWGATVLFCRYVCAPAPR